MKLRSVLQLSSVAMLLVTGSALTAQVTTGSIAGAVKDSKGNPIEGARITLTSPGLISPRVLVTDTRGEWHAPLLMVGNYRIQASKASYVGAEASNVRVGIGSNTRQDLVLKPVKALEATVEVTASVNEVDKAATSTATNYSADLLETMAGSDRSFAGASDLAPGIATTSSGGTSVRGGTTQSTLYRLNGADIKDDYQGGQVGTWVIEDNIDDVQVVLSPLNARNGRAISGSINVVTKSGGNDFAGSIRAHLDRPSWTAKTPYSNGQAGQVNDNLSRTYDVTISGPIVKDRLWFNLGTILTPSGSTSYSIPPGSTSAVDPMRTNIPGVDAALVSAVTNGYNGYMFDPLTGRAPYTQTTTSHYFEGKLTGAISPDHIVEVSLVDSGDTINNRNPYGDGGSTVRRVQELGSQTDKQSAWGLHYRGVLSSSMFLEARYNRYNSQAQFPTGDPAFKSDAVDYWLDNAWTQTAPPKPHGFTDVGYPFGLGISPAPDKRDNSSWNINLNMFRTLGSTEHEFDFGAENYTASRTTSTQSGSDNAYFRTGGAFFNPTVADPQQAWLFPTLIWMGPGLNGQSGSGNTGLAPIMEQYTGQDGKTQNLTNSLYANDNITFNKHFGLMAGLRFDKISVNDTNGQRLASNQDFSPRLQLRYDIQGNSHHLVTFTAARFGSDYTTGFTDAFVHKANASGIFYGWSGVAGQTVPSGANPLAWVNYPQLTNPANYTQLVNGASTAYNYFNNSQVYTVDSKLTAPMLDEYTLTYRRNYDNGNFVRVTYVDRAWKNNWAYKTDYDAADMTVITDPTVSATLPNGSGLASLGIPRIYVFNSNAIHREYHGLELEFSNRLSQVWTMTGNYTYGRLTGNDNSGDSVTSTFRDNGVSGLYGNSAYLTAEGVSTAAYAPNGPLIADQTHRVRINFTADLPLGQGKISYAFLLRYDSGNNWSASSPAPYDQATGGGIPRITLPGPGGTTINTNTPPATFTNYYGGRGQYTYNDTYQVDFKLAYHVPLYDKVQLIGDVRINNLFNTIITGTYDNSAYPIGGYGANALYLNLGTFGTSNPANGNYWNSGRTVLTTIGLRF